MKYIYGTCDIPLPDIYSVYTPEIQEEFPYVLLQVYTWGSTEWNALLRMFKEPSTAYSDFGMDEGTVFMVSGYTAPTKEELSNGAFPEPEEQTYHEDDILVSIDRVWANHDILWENGLVYVAASDPIPVPQLNPAALMQGFLVGQAIKRNR